MDLVTKLTEDGFVPSMAAARRLIHIGGVRVDGGITLENIEVPEGAKITMRKAKGCTSQHKTTPVS